MSRLWSVAVAGLAAGRKEKEEDSFVVNKKKFCRGVNISIRWYLFNVVHEMNSEHWT